MLGGRGNPRRCRCGDAAWPDITAFAVPDALATSVILAGMVGAVGAVKLERIGRPGWLVAAYLLLVLLGVLLLAPGEGITGIVWLRGAYAVPFGTTVTIGPRRLRERPEQTDIV
ncbi:hypothetical protein FXW78_23455 [Rhodococcus opacus]|nr:hypothetical protein [Rhodococcus opacus]